MNKDFERGLSEWGGRPPKTRPEVAATRVKARLHARPHAFARRGLLAAAAVVVAALIGVGWLALRDDPVSIAATDPPVLEENVVLWWIDPETPVYFVLSPPNCK